MHDSHYREHGPWTRVSFGRGPCSRNLGLHEPWTRFVFTAVLFVVLYPSVLPTEKIANMMSLQTENKLSYTTEFVITYEKEKIEKSYCCWLPCEPVCYSWNETYKDDDLLVGHATGLCVAMSAVSEVHVHLRQYKIGYSDIWKSTKLLISFRKRISWTSTRIKTNRMIKNQM